MSDWAQMLSENEPWQAEITRANQFCWHIDPVQGITGLREGYLAIGTYRHAERKARRVIRRLERADHRAAARIIITGGQP